jgi:hypothetical protein
MLKRFVQILIFSLLGVACAPALGYDLDTLGVPKFVGTHYIDLSKIYQISKFRSSAGHDYSDDTEKCRSMKHYFMRPDATTAIWSPVAGTVTQMRDDFVGTQVHIKADVQPDFTFIVFHVALARPLLLGEHLAEGQLLGTHVGLQTFSDIAVAVNAAGGYRLVSYFDTLTDAAFAPLQSRGITSPAQLSFTRAERDAAPFLCSGQVFSNLKAQPDTDYISLTGGAPPTASSLVVGPITERSILLTVSPPEPVLGLTGGVFVVATLPPTVGGGISLMSGTGAWSPYRGCENAPAALQGMLYAGAGVNVLPVPMDLSVLQGTALYVGYGIGSTSSIACRNMLDAKSFGLAYTID